MATNHELERFSSQSNAFDLVEREALLAPVIKLGRAWALMRRHDLRMLERAAILQVCGNSGGTEGMATDGRHDAGDLGSPPDHTPGVSLAHRLVGQSACLPSLGGGE